MSTCPLCERFKQLSGRAGQPSFSTSDYGNLRHYSCPRCGQYTTTEAFADRNAAGLQLEQGLALSGLVRRATDRGDASIEIMPGTAAALAASAPVPRRFAAYVDNLLLYVAARSRYPGTSTGPMNLEHVAARAFLPFDSCYYLFVQLEKRGLLTVKKDELVRFEVMLNPPGWERVDELQRGGAGGTAVFVAMWFGDELRDAYDLGIKPALEDSGFEGPFRVDDLDHEERVGHEGYESKIDDRIMAEIRRARFVVADITGARQAVYYEAGFAAGLGIPVIWTGKAESFEHDKCFDTQQFGHVVWQDVRDLRSKLTNLLRARGWQGPSAVA